MKFSFALLSSLVFMAALRAGADDVLPPRFKFDRYSAMVNHSPFAVATAAALPETTPNFAGDLYVANAARSSEGDTATIRSSSDQNFKKYLTTKEAVDGYSIARIEWSEKVGETKVTISKDGKFATLTFNQALLSQTASGRPPAAGLLQAGTGQASHDQWRKETRRHINEEADAMNADLERLAAKQMQLLPPPIPEPPSDLEQLEGEELRNVPSPAQKLPSALEQFRERELQQQALKRKNEQAQ